MFKAILSDFKGYYSNIKEWLFLYRHNEIFNRVVMIAENKALKEDKTIYAILNADRQFEYITKTELNRRRKQLRIKPDVKLRIVTFYKTDCEDKSYYRDKFISYAKYLKEKK